MELIVLRCNADDHGTQRCRLAPEVMDDMGLVLGSCVQLRTNNRTFLCCVWPSNDGRKNTISFDSTIHFDTTSRRQVDRGYAHHRALVEKVSTCKLTTVDVTIVFSNTKNVKHYAKILKEDGSEGTGMILLKRNIRALLRNFYVASNTYVDCSGLKLGKLYKISLIKINAFETDDRAARCGVLTEGTQISVHQVMSHERFQGRTKCAHLVCAGFDVQRNSLKDLLRLPYLHASRAKQIGVEWPRGVIIQGPSGSGKTTLVQEAARESDAILITGEGPALVGARPGEGEEKLRKLFAKALDMTEEATCVLLIEDIECLCPRRSKTGDGSGSLGRRMVAQLGLLLDGLTSKLPLLVVATSSRPQMVDPVLRRPGRFEKEIFLGVPTTLQRKQMLKELTRGLKTEQIDLTRLAESTPGFLAADLKSLVNKAHFSAVTGTESGSDINMQHFQKALHAIVPSTQRCSDVLVDHHPVTWQDVGGLDDVKVQLKQAVEWPLNHGASFTRLGIKRPSGVLLYGPPGCAKTLLVRAAATACGATFLAVSGAQLLSPFVGEAEKKLTEVFRQARAGSPTILFLDEVDAVMGKRREGVKSGGPHERVLSTLLNEMDGVGLRVEDLVRDHSAAQKLLEEPTSDKSEGETEVEPAVESSVDNSGVLVVAATNRPDLIDDALMRPGRLDKIIYVPPPDEQARMEILRVHTRNTPCCDVDLHSIAQATEGYTGADLENLCREAALHALSVDGLEAEHISQDHFNFVLNILKPSLTSDQMRGYAECLNR